MNYFVKIYTYIYIGIPIYNIYIYKIILYMVKIYHNIY